MALLPRPSFPRPPLPRRSALPPLLLAALVAPPSARAQIVTDRPDFVESSATVGPRTVQVEASVAHARDGGARYWSTPTLVRVGVGERLELRAESELFVRRSVSDVSASGIADLSLGLKWAAASGTAGPAVALLAHVDLPTGSTLWRGEDARPSLRVVLEQELPSDFGLGLMPGVLVESGPDGRYAAGLLGVVIGKGWTDRFRSFVELGLEHVAGDADGGTTGSWNAGSALLLTENAQLDAAVSFGATSSSTPFSVTIGYSHRLAPGSSAR